jgi:hypothetical protein
VPFDEPRAAAPPLAAGNEASGHGRWASPCTPGADRRARFEPHSTSTCHLRATSDGHVLRSSRAIPHSTLGKLDQPLVRLDSPWVRSGLGACRIEPVGQVLQGVRE